ncbi:hypothetical protein HMN09_01079800 [Mycena chlorophos]|uniref:Uncharacterized protein n=1 Tax=Mycena chlorophos TaxID=658473 RepID=A0A8H6SD19_MYCCL|nr:hypothetical protein HMN09_01079800 [Mycena chlorophos]
MLWFPLARTTRSGRVFAEFVGTGQSIAPLLARAIARESDGQLDAEPGDVAPLSDPLDELDELDPPFMPDDQPPRKKQHVELAEGPTQATKALSGSHRRRASKRRRDVAIHGHTARPETIAEHVHTADFQNTDFPTQLLPTATGAYVAKMEDADELGGSKKERSVEEYLAQGFHLVETGGSEAKPLVDSNNRVFGVYVSPPDNPTYAASHKSAYQELVDASLAAKFPAAFKRHRAGGGQTTPSWLESDYPAVAERLLASTNFNRLAGFASASLGLWAPRLHGYYVDYSQKFDGFGLPRTRPFPASVFAAAAFNFGPRAWTHKHRDVLNLPFGWCAIIALGKFDPTKGGHLVLWDLKLIIEFPAGSPFSSPPRRSHSNVKVQSHEMRASFTQFTAGGLFRFVDNGFRTEDGFAAEEPEAYLEAQAAKEGRWKTGLGLWSTVEELMAALFWPSSKGKQTPRPRHTRSSAATAQPPVSTAGTSQRPPSDSPPSSPVLGKRTRREDEEDEEDDEDEDDEDDEGDVDEDAQNIWADRRRKRRRYYGAENTSAARQQRHREAEARYQQRNAKVCSARSSAWNKAQRDAVIRLGGPENDERLRQNRVQVKATRKKRQTISNQLVAMGFPDRLAT